MSRSKLKAAVFALFPVFISYPSLGADIHHQIAKCSVIPGDTQRLKCYDKLARKSGQYSSNKATSPKEDEKSASHFNNNGFGANSDNSASSDVDKLPIFD